MGFRGAHRGQSEVIGALLIFAVIVAFIGLNQAFLVPQANEDVEFKHHNDVQRDIVDLRTAITEAAASNEPRSRSIDLGTDYPSRFVAINPPPATGTIRTVDGDGGIDANHDDLDLSAVCGTPTDEPGTKFLTYRPDYNEHQNALPTTVENTVAYRATNGEPIYSTGQMFAQGRQINIIRYVGDVAKTASGTTSLDLVPSETGVDTIDTSNETLNVTLPTRLSDSDWRDLVDTTQVKPHDVPDEDRVKFEFANDTTYTVRCTTIGINEEPDVNPSVFSTDSGDENSFNPAGTGSVKFDSTSVVDNTVTVTLENLASDNRTITEARIPFYSTAEISNANAENPESIDFTDDGISEGSIGGTYTTVDGDTIEPGEKGGISFNLYCENGGSEFGVSDEDFFILGLQFDNGGVSNYFIEPDDGGNSNKRCKNNS